MKTHPTHSIPANIWHFLKMAYAHYKIVFVLFAFHTIAGAILPLMSLYLPRLAVGLAIDNQGMAHVMLSLGGFAALFVLLSTLSQLASIARFPFQNAMRNVYHRLMFLKAMDCDYHIMEDSDGQNWYSRAVGCFMRGDWSVNHRMINGAQSLISGGISFLFITGLLMTLHPLVVVGLVGLSALGFAINAIPRRFEEKTREESGDIDRKLSYVEHTMGNIAAAKDMRLYNLPQIVGALKNGLYAQLHKLRTRGQNRHYLAGSLNSLLTLVRDGAAYAYCIWQVLEGNITIPEFTLFMAAIAAFSHWLGGLLDSINQLKAANVEANDVRAFFDYTNQMDPPTPLDINILGKHIAIQFKDVHFRYQPEGPDVLRGLSFTMNAKEKVALVGINGAGKTTIIKLLCGFYKATQGEILLNGHNINQFKRADLYGLFSAVFQDICILPFTVAENVTFQPEGEQDIPRLMFCLEAAGIKDAIMAHPEGVQALMTKLVDENGLMLSGGQQQKLTIARALYKNSPLLILDEPTAALDPIAESEVYESFHHLTEDKTALYISHRLASTRFCDNILMLKDGQIAEQGNHQQLMDLQGEYAHMFDVQSHYYKKEVSA